MPYKPSIKLLAWYDNFGRTLPWRTKKGVGSSSNPNAYRIWISEIMLQQTTVPVVRQYYEKFLGQWPTIEDLSVADPDEVMACWAGLGYYTRARNLIPCAKIIVRDFNGQFPRSTKKLLELPGIGPYTASAIQAIAFDQSVPVVDGNAERVYSRVRGLTTPLPQSKPEIKRIAEQMTPKNRPGDYAQAIMDLGSVVCKPRSPDCADCPWKNVCKSYQMGLQHEIPYRSPKRPKPTRAGTLFICLNENSCFMLERRPQKGLLGGTLGWPGTGWEERSDGKFPVLSGGVELPGKIVHVFTHFRTSIVVKVGSVVTSDFSNLDVVWAKRDEFDATALTTLMKKAYMHTSRHFDFDALVEEMRVMRV